MNSCNAFIRSVSNHEVASLLEETGKLLEQQGANPYRAQAYQRAGETLRGLSKPVSDLVVEGGTEALTQLERIGESIAGTIQMILTEGRIPLLDRLREQSKPESLLSTIGGIGTELARRLHNELGVRDLPELEQVVSTGKLEKVRGFGEKRVRHIRESLFSRLQNLTSENSQSGQIQKDNRSQGEKKVKEPAVAALLSIDEEYRIKARRRELPELTPKNFNPTGEAWLPILRCMRSKSNFTAHYSNSLKAHEYGAMRDWVVSHRDSKDGGGGWTVLTSNYGVLRGKRIVRGREEESKRYYRRVKKGDDKKKRGH